MSTINQSHTQKNIEQTQQLENPQEKYIRIRYLCQSERRLYALRPFSPSLPSLLCPSLSLLSPSLALPSQPTLWICKINPHELLMALLLLSYPRSRTSLLGYSAKLLHNSPTINQSDTGQCLGFRRRRCQKWHSRKCTHASNPCRHPRVTHDSSVEISRSRAQGTASALI